MNVTQILDQIQGRTDDYPSVDGDIANHRQRLLEGLIAVYNHVWMAQDWPWALSYAELSVVAGVGSFTETFSHIPINGGVWRTVADGGGLVPYATPQELLTARSVGVSGPPTAYSIFGHAETTYYRLIHTDTLWTGTLDCRYTRVPRVLDEAASVNEVKSIPEHFHHTVLIPGLRAIAREAKSNANGIDFTLDPAFKVGLSEMIERSMRVDKSHGRRIPGASGT